MGEPIFYLETDIIIELEESNTQSDTEISYGMSIVISNLGNIQREPIITISSSSDLTYLNIVNETTSCSITLSGFISAGSVYTFYYDSAYKDSAEITPNFITMTLGFNKLFYIQENIDNIIRFYISPSGAASIGVTTTLIKPNGGTVTQAYVEGFTLNKSMVQKKRTGGILNLYSKGQITNEINYDFTINKMFCDQEFVNSEDDTYRITYKTTDTAIGVPPQTYYLCGCKFSTYGLSQNEGEFVKENLAGTVVKMIEG